MCCRNASFIVLSMFLILFCDKTSSECRQLAPCICSMPDGHYYDLTGLADAEPFQVIDKKYDWEVHFHPCTNVKMKLYDNTTCANGSGVSLCMHSNKNEILTGTIEETRMKWSAGGNFPIFEIRNNGTTSLINIVCLTDVQNKTIFSFDPSIPSDSKNFYFMLVSSYGCKIQEKRLSMGSVLVILFFVSIGLYFIGGIITLKALRGATGWEMVPNHDFWCKLPSLVRDGIVFTFNCCRADSYERI